MGGFPKVASSCESRVPFPASFFFFSRLPRPWASGTGPVGRLLRGRARPRRSGGSGPRAAEPGSEGDPELRGCRGGESGRPAGLLAAPWAPCVALGSPVHPGALFWGRLSVAPRLCDRAPGPAPEPCIPGCGACRLLCAPWGRAAGLRGCGKGPARSICPIAPESAWSGEPEIESELGGARRGPRWDASAGRSLQILGSRRSWRRAGPGPGGGDPQLLLRDGQGLSGMDSGGHHCEVHRDWSSTLSPGAA